MRPDPNRDLERLTRTARALAYAWNGTDPMRGNDDVRRAMLAVDVDPNEIDDLLPYVVDACEEAGLIRDPADMGALLRAAVSAYAAREGISQAEVARRAGIEPGNLSRAFGRPDADARTVRAICRTIGTHVELAPDFRLYIDGREIIEDVDLSSEESATRAAVALLTGCAPGTTGRVDRYTYPTRRGAHAYAAARSWSVDADGRAVESR